VEVLDPSTVLGVVVNSCNSTSDQKYYYSRYHQPTSVEPAAPLADD